MGRPPWCDKTGVKKGPWTPEEDIVLVSYIQEHGPGNWRSVPSKTGLLRCSKSCRLRWTNYLRPGIRRGNFSDQEEKMIIHLQALLGNSKNPFVETETSNNGKRKRQSLPCEASTLVNQPDAFNSQWSINYTNPDVSQTRPDGSLWQHESNPNVEANVHFTMIEKWLFDDTTVQLQGLEDLINVSLQETSVELL